jgi:hypothetical protein
MLRRFSSGLVLVVALVAAVVPVATAAEPAPKGLEGSFALKGTHGFKLFALVASTGKSGVLILSVAKKGEAATYVAHGEVTPESVAFDLGNLGRIDVAVQPNGKSETLNSECGGGGRSTIIPSYDYVGTIEFHGEEGFTEAKAARTHLLLGTTLNKIVCSTSVSGEDFGPATPGVRIRARQTQGPKVQLNQSRPGAGVVYSAQITEQEGTMRVERSVGGRLGAGALSYAPPLGSAVFTGAGPFEGKATYTGVHPPHGTHPGKGTWRGSLKVNFPGRAGVRLAGPGFSAGIIHSQRSETRG